MNICIFGAASRLIEQTYKDAAYEAGKALAQAGHDLVFGGGAEGMMGASALGFKDGGGHVLGVIPEFFRIVPHENLYENCHETIYTADVSERIKKMEEISDAFLVLPGGVGTYEEFFKVLVSKSLGQHQKPLALLNIDGYFDHLQTMLEDGVSKQFIGPKRIGLFRVFETDQLTELAQYLESREEEPTDKIIW